jgi:hypothetical protein
MDLGKGDVVEAIHDVDVHPRWTDGHGFYAVRQGQRAIVEEVRSCHGYCTDCGQRAGLVGLRLVEYPLAPFVLWCPCEWRKIGGSIDEHVAQFKAHLGAPAPAVGPFRRFIEKVRG